MSDAANVDEAGNSVIAWYGTAGNLLAARDTLVRQRDKAEEKALGVSGSRMLGPEVRSYWVEVMLIGFAVENLLKAFWIARGNQMYAAGKLLKIPGAKNHDLVAIADAVDFTTEKTERTSLAMLSEIMTGVGRYPLAVQPRLTESWGSDDDDSVRKLPPAMDLNP